MSVWISEAERLWLSLNIEVLLMKNKNLHVTDLKQLSRLRLFVRIRLKCKLLDQLTVVMWCFRVCPVSDVVTPHEH